MKNIRPLKIIHADDDADFRQSFKNLLYRIPDIPLEYEGGFATAEKALDFLHDTGADLLFSETVLPDGDGLWLAESIRKTGTDIVFVTAYSDYAVKAFELCALNYLMKPADEDKVHSVLKAAQALHSTDKGIIPSPKNAGRNPERIFISMTGYTTVVKPDDILYFNSSSSYTVVALRNSERHISSKTMGTFEKMLKGNDNFIRISRSHIVNKNHVKSIQRNGKTRQISLTLINDETLLTSYKTKEDAVEALGG